MRVFEEKQRFNQWWLYIIFIPVLIVLLMGIYRNSEGFTNFHSPLIVLFLIAAVIPMLLILSMQLETRINHEGISAKFIPFGFSKKFFPWKEMDQCFIRKYKPLSEYGGYGIRGLGGRKAYNVSGNIGIQIVTRDKKSFLIGTNKPEKARAVIKNYEHKINAQFNKY